MARAKTDREIAKYLVQAYLNDCGGIRSGFDFGEQEEALQIAIERELKNARKPKRPARPRKEKR